MGLARVAVLSIFMLKQAALFSKYPGQTHDLHLGKWIIRSPKAQVSMAQTKHEDSTISGSHCH